MKHNMKNIIKIRTYNDSHKAEYNIMKYKLASDALNIALWDMNVVQEDPINSENTFTWSREFRQMLGFTDESDFPNVLHSWSDRLHPDDRERALKAFAAHISDYTGKTPYNLEYRLMHKNGEYRYFHAFGATQRDSDGMPLRVAGALMDINRKKKMEEALKENNKRAMLILNSMPLACHLWSRDLKMFDCNDENMRLFKMKNKDDISKNFCKYSPKYQPDGQLSSERAAEMIMTAFNEGRLVCEYMHRTSDNEPLPVEMTLVRVPYSDDYAVAAYVRDLREHKKMMQELGTAFEKAESASKAKGDFLSSMSHEMRTPMNAIIGMTLIGKKAQDTEGKNYALDRIEEASSHLLAVINDVLDMAKIEANKLELVPVEYEFEKMLQKVMTVINFRVEEKRQVFSVSIDEKIPRFIIGDDHRLAQVITNLLSNAVKFTPEGGKIHLGASLIGEKNGVCELRICVEDNGIGISPEQQKKLFQAFEQAESDTGRQYGGTGLGLLISKRIIELMDGKAIIDSELGKGAKFIFTMKAKRGKHANECINEVHDENKQNAEYDFSGKRMLLAEDMEINREILTEVLKETGIIIDCAENGKKAFEMVTEAPKKYDIIFMDVQMPIMNGLEATRRIRCLLALKGIRLPIIAMTANVFKDDVEACFKAGMDDHLGKPLDVEKVMETLQKYLNV